MNTFQTKSMAVVCAVIFFLLLGVAQSAAAQSAAIPSTQYRPSVTECRALNAKWSIAWIADRRLRCVPVSTVMELTDEIRTCTVSDSPNVVRYATLLNALDSLVNDRLTGFVSRQDLWPQFIAEDAAGNR
jgi:hypothetical protein